MTSPSQTLPLVVQVGFAGSRTLIDTERYPGISEVEVSAAVEAVLKSRLETLKGELGLTRHFLCGISQIAIGGDIAFARACQSIGLKQRIFLPQPLDQYLMAQGEQGPDFSEAQREDATRLLEGSQVVQVRVVSNAATREQRFEEVNIEIARVSDVMIGVLREGSLDHPGGTEHALRLARRRKIPIFKIVVSVVDGKPKAVGSWEPNAKLEAPTLPHADWPGLSSGSAEPTFGDYCRELLEWGSKVADLNSRFFATSAFVVIATHLAATICAATVLALHGSHQSSHGSEWLPPLLLLIEICLLMSGFAVHQWLHKSEAPRQWALTRSVAELARSMQAASSVHAYLDYLFSLPYPPELRPLLRTLSVLHATATRTKRESPWEETRDHYLKSRVLHQRLYFCRMSRRARAHLGVAHAIFVGCTLLALFATAAKLFVVSGLGGERAAHGEALTPWLGTLAIVLPVLAVGALSFSASLDREARVQIFAEMSRFLKARAHDFKRARSRLEFERLVVETECRLLGENANWFARRSYTAVS